MGFVYENNLTGDDLALARRLAASVGETEVADSWSPLDAWAMDRERNAVLLCFAPGHEGNPHARPGGKYYLFVDKVPNRIFVVLRSSQEPTANGGTQSIAIYDRVQVMSGEGSPTHLEMVALLARDALQVYGSASYSNPIRVNLA